MKRRSLLKVGGAGALALGSSAALAKSKDRFNWKLVMSWPKNFPGLASSMDWFVDEIRTVSNGRLNITLYGAGELVPAFEVFNAVSEGSAEMGHGSPYYWKGSIPEAEFFTSVPFGMLADEFTSWFMDDDGHKLLTELYKPFSVVPFIGGNTGMQMGGWFNKEIKSVADLNGLKIRMPGIGGEIYKMSGASPVSMSGSEIFTSMQSGVLDATDWVSPWNDLAFGLHRVAKYYYYGWQEPSALMEILINEKAWQSLPSDLQTLVKTTCEALNQRVINSYMKNNAISLQNLMNNHQVELRAFPDDVMALFKENTQKYIANFAEKSDLARRVVESYQSYQKGQMAYAKNRLNFEKYRG